MSFLQCLFLYLCTGFVIMSCEIAFSLTRINLRVDKFAFFFGTVFWPLVIPYAFGLVFDGYINKLYAIRKKRIHKIQQKTRNIET